MKTLDDYLRPGLRIVSIGLNPSLPSVEAGFYFANPRNRFWRALNASDLIDAPLEPSRAAMKTLLERENIGFTDVVKRPTRQGAELRAADYRRDAPRLERKLAQYEPDIAWFHGKQAYAIYLRYAQGQKGVKVEWGAQDRRIGKTRVFVTPNPSPANAAFSLDDITEWFSRLGSFAGGA